jgi:hypothetical protein
MQDNFRFLFRDGSANAITHHVTAVSVSSTAPSGNARGFLLTPHGLMTREDWDRLQARRAERRERRIRARRAALIAIAERQRAYLFKKDNDLISPVSNRGVEDRAGVTPQLAKIVETPAG